MAWRSPRHRSLTIEVEQEGGTFEDRASGELDVSNSKLLQEALGRALDSAYARIVLDLEHVDRIDSTGLGILLWGAKRSRESDRLRIRLRSSAAVRRMVERTGVDRALPLTS